MEEVLIAIAVKIGVLKLALLPVIGILAGFSMFAATNTHIHSQNLNR